MKMAASCRSRQRLYDRRVGDLHAALIFAYSCCTSMIFISRVIIVLLLINTINLKIRVSFSFKFSASKNILSFQIPVIDSRPDTGVPRLIGSLTGHGIWLAVRGSQLTVFNQYRAQEVLLYHRLLANHRLPRQTLPVPITLTSRLVFKLIPHL